MNSFIMDTQPSKNINLKEKKNKILVRDDKIVYLEIAKEPLLEEDVWKILEDIREILKRIPGKAKVLINIRSFSIIRSSQFRKKASDIIRDTIKNIEYEKIAIVGWGVLVKTIASFMFVASGIKNAKTFNTEKEALKWLRQE